MYTFEVMNSNELVKNRLLFYKGLKIKDDY